MEHLFSAACTSLIHIEAGIHCKFHVKSMNNNVFIFGIKDALTKNALYA